MHQYRCDIGSWFEHAYGEAIDVNPVENPNGGCGTSGEASAGVPLRIGWGWVGDWGGIDPRLLHFSATSH